MVPLVLSQHFELGLEQQVCLGSGSFSATVGLLAQQDEVGTDGLELQQEGDGSFGLLITSAAASSFDTDTLVSLRCCLAAHRVSEEAQQASPLVF